jgi:Carboxypeptidase regulatory-like domain
MVGTHGLSGLRRETMRSRSVDAVAGTPRSLLLLTLIVASLPSPIAGQLLLGAVRDRETSAPLVGVYVVLEAGEADGMQAAALTDESGRFVLSAEVGFTYRLRAERVGLATEVTGWFTFEGRSPPRIITMSERAVRLDGLTVSAPVRTCRLEPEQATVVQRWWDEVRKALEATTLTEATDAVGLRFERFEREWSPNLRTLRRERALPTDSASTRPFLSQDAETLSERGFVQGREGDRLFLAPDAAVLFSEAFLADHCLGIAEEKAEVAGVKEPVSGELLLTVEPMRRRRSPDIRGVLEVDTLSGELRSFDFNYVNLPPDLPRSRAGGHLAFEYLPSGAWIVSEWWIRMPQIGRSAGWIGRAKSILVGYLDRGGRVAEIRSQGTEADRRFGGATLYGTVYDSLTATPLAGARVWVVGSRYSVRTDVKGRFTLANIPPGPRGITFYHPELARRGIPSPVVPVEVRGGSSATLALAVPGFTTIASLFCEDSADPPDAILTGTVLREGGAEPAPAAEVRANWTETGGAARSMRAEATAGSDGRYFLCGLPSAVPVSLAVRTASGLWRETGSVELPERRIVMKELRPGTAARAIVRGIVRSEGDGAPLEGTNLVVLAVTGDTVASTRADSGGRFEVRMPPGVGYRAVAVREGYLREASIAFTLDGAETLDIRFELIRDVAMEIEGLVVEIEARNRRTAKRLLRQYGENETTMGRRWIGVAALDSLPVLGETDPGVVIQSMGIPGVRVDQAQKYGPNPILCVRAKPRQCAIIVLNGVQIDPSAALLLDFRDLEGIAVLRPEDSATFFGTMGGGGAVILWMRGSGR